MKKLLAVACLLLPFLAFSGQQGKSDQAWAEKGSRAITVQVNIAQHLLPEDADNWTLYVYAAQPNTRLPLANFKGKLSQLPGEVILDESMYLLPHLTLRQAEEVVIVAKASKSKNPHKKSAEDVIGYSGALNFSLADKLEASVTIDQNDVAQ
ncbi:hypothetical protein [Thalassomonas actiniarum]|uniref:Cytochrome c-type biogenesis protein H Ig-like domain-containing protein n=1 Tax=Thalassomonas actiniarum TaxID=485447 RepID=A0AAF0C327_9GAMM|nr:hypothetical protein [Thalassomonas actiniarum]WDE00762.1 hypothetical protein SG35_009080 [Thalassomonas actiniarum]